jgi:hypothetical protein
MLPRSIVDKRFAIPRHQVLVDAAIALDSLVRLFKRKEVVASTQVAVDAKVEDGDFSTKGATAKPIPTFGF